MVCLDHKCLDINDQPRFLALVGLEFCQVLDQKGLLFAIDFEELVGGLGSLHPAHQPTLLDLVLLLDLYLLETL